MKWTSNISLPTVDEDLLLVWAMIPQRSRQSRLWSRRYAPNAVERARVSKTWKATGKQEWRCWNQPMGEICERWYPMDVREVGMLLQCHRIVDHRREGMLMLEDGPRPFSWLGGARWIRQGLWGFWWWPWTKWPALLSFGMIGTVICTTATVRTENCMKIQGGAAWTKEREGRKQNNRQRGFDASRRKCDHPLDVQDRQDERLKRFIFIDHHHCRSRAAAQITISHREIKTSERTNCQTI